MKIYPIYFEENGVRQILELCLTRDDIINT